MEINEHKDLGVVDIWLTRKDQTDPAARAKVRELSRQYKTEKMIVAVFYSGQLDLEEETGALLRYNRLRSAGQDVQQWKARKQRECRKARPVRALQTASDRQSGLPESGS